MAAAVTLLAAVLTVVLAVVVAITDFPQGVGVLGCVAVALVAAWFGVLRGGRQRTMGVAVAVLALWRRGSADPQRWLASPGVTRARHRDRACGGPCRVPGAHSPSGRRPSAATGVACQPVVRRREADKVGAAEASSRGIRAVELRRGDDLEQLVRDAVAAGADGLAAAGGDGTQAIVATAAAEHGLPYACIPAGTRNHFALDLGVDRDDVVGALDAFVNGGEHLVDLGEVNGRVFVNNVSMGLYAEAVQSEGYRDAKIRTLLDTAPTALGPAGPTRPALDLPRWCRPRLGGNDPGVQQPLPARSRSRLRDPPANGYRAARCRRGAGPRRGRRARAASSLLRQWSTVTFQVDSTHPVPLGIDGEAVVLEPPIRFRIRPGVLRVRIAPQHPGASPSAMQPDHAGDGLRVLAAIAAGRGPTDR